MRNVSFYLENLFSVSPLILIKKLKIAHVYSWRNSVRSTSIVHGFDISVTLVDTAKYDQARYSSYTVVYYYAKVTW